MEEIGVPTLEDIRFTADVPSVNAAILRARELFKISGFAADESKTVSDIFR